VVYDSSGDVHPRVAWRDGAAWRDALSGERFDADPGRPQVGPRGAAWVLRATLRAPTRHDGPQAALAQTGSGSELAVWLTLTACAAGPAVKLAFHELAGVFYDMDMATNEDMFVWIDTTRWEVAAESGVSGSCAFVKAVVEKLDYYESGATRRKDGAFTYDVDSEGFARAAQEIRKDTLPAAWDAIVGGCRGRLRHLPRYAVHTVSSADAGGGGVAGAPGTGPVCAWGPAAPLGAGNFAAGFGSNACFANAALCVLVQVPAVRAQLQVATGPLPPTARDLQCSRIAEAARGAGRAMWEGRGSAVVRRGGHPDLATTLALRAAVGGRAATGAQCDAAEFCMDVLNALLACEDRAAGVANFVEEDEQLARLQERANDSALRREIGVIRHEEYRCGTCHLPGARYAWSPNVLVVMQSVKGFKKLHTAALRRLVDGALGNSAFRERGVVTWSGGSRRVGNQRMDRGPTSYSGIAWV
jgi:hypothetical protein